MGQIKITHMQGNGKVEVHITDGSLSDAVPLLREVMASCDKKKDLEVSVVELNPTGDDTTLLTDVGQNPQERNG